MKIYDLCVNEGLVGGIYRYRAARGGLNFKIYGVCFDMLFVLMCYAAGGGNFIADRSLWRSNDGIALALYAQLWPREGVSEADALRRLVRRQ